MKSMMISALAAAVALPLIGAGAATATLAGALLAAGPAHAEGMRSSVAGGKGTRVHAPRERRQGKAAGAFARTLPTRPASGRSYVTGYFWLDLDGPARPSVRKKTSLATAPGPTFGRTFDGSPRRGRRTGERARLRGGTWQHDGWTGWSSFFRSM